MSPPIAELIRAHDGLRAMVRAILTPIVWTVNVWMNGYAGVQWVFMSLVLLWGKNRLGDQVGVNR